MKLQSLGALVVVAIWLLNNIAAVTVTILNADLGQRTETFKLTELDPLIGQMALVALVGSAIIWLTGGLIRKIIAGFNSLAIGILVYQGIVLIADPVQKLQPKLSSTGSIEDISFSMSSYALIALAAISVFLFLVATRLQVADRSSRPKLATEKDIWREQDEGRDSTK